MKRSIEWIPVKDIIPYKNNPRINDQSVEALARALIVYGFQTAIEIDENNVILSGHARLKAAIHNGMKEVPCVRILEFKGDEAKKDGYRIAHNKSHESSKWNLEILDLTFDKLKLKKFDLDNTLFTAHERANIGAPVLDFDPDATDPGPAIAENQKVTTTCPKCGFSWKD